MPITEILQGQFNATLFGNVGPIGNYNSFVVNTAVDQVALDMGLPHHVNVFTNANGAFRFAANDNLTILSMWITLPYHFALGDGSPYVLLYRGVNVPVMIPEIAGGASSGLQLPVINSETSLGVYVPWRAEVGAVGMCLGVSLAGMNISMIGTPAIINGNRYRPRVYLKVVHNLELGI